MFIYFLNSVFFCQVLVVLWKVFSIPYSLIIIKLYKYWRNLFLVIWVYRKLLCVWMTTVYVLSQTKQEFEWFSNQIKMLNTCDVCVFKLYQETRGCSSPGTFQKEKIQFSTNKRFVSYPLWPVARYFNTWIRW